MHAPVRVEYLRRTKLGKREKRADNDSRVLRTDAEMMTQATNEGVNNHSSSTPSHHQGNSSNCNNSRSRGPRQYTSTYATDTPDT